MQMVELIKKINKANTDSMANSGMSEESKENLDYILYQMEELAEYQEERTTITKDRFHFYNGIVNLIVNFNKDTYLIESIECTNNYLRERLVWVRSGEDNKDIPSAFNYLD